MAAQNLSEDGQQKAVRRLNLFARFQSWTERPVDISFGLNAFMSVTALLGNALILIGLIKESSLHPPSKLLLRSLATTDLCVGFTSEPLTVICWMSVANGHRNICRYTSPLGFTTANIFCGVSVLTLTSISVDRFLALLLGLRYCKIVTYQMFESFFEDGIYFYSFEDKVRYLIEYQKKTGRRSVP